MKKSMIPLISVLLALSQAPLNAQAPYAKPDDSWIAISGTVISPSANSFMLDYGEGNIRVEMDDWDWYREGYNLLDGDKVTVYGRIDDDLFESSKIEAGSVYVESLNSYFYANPADEEDPIVTVFAPVDVSTTVVQGVVSGVSGREFTLRTGSGTLTVDTALMPYNPMDNQGFQQVKVSDRVRVSGDMDYDLFEKRELMARSLTTLSQDRTKKPGT